MGTRHHTTVGTQEALDKAAKNLEATGYTRAKLKETRGRMEYYLGPQTDGRNIISGYILVWESDEGH